jgi:putative sporulation protein YyaC
MEQIRHDYVDSSDTNAKDILCNLIEDYVQNVGKQYKRIGFLCIGTDRLTGDSLGPIIGTKLAKKKVPNVYGTLENPLHAKNIEQVMKTIPKNMLLIAIDCSVGKVENIGRIGIHSCGCKPRAAIDDSLPRVGDITITGIVTIDAGSKTTLFFLQGTRLYTVINLASIITEGIIKYNQVRKSRKKQQVLEVG